MLYSDGHFKWVDELKATHLALQKPHTLGQLPLFARPSCSVFTIEHLLMQEARDLLAGVGELKQDTLGAALKVRCTCELSADCTAGCTTMGWKAPVRADHGQQQYLHAYLNMRCACSSLVPATR